MSVSTLHRRALSAVWFFLAAALSSAAPATTRFESAVKPFLRANCVSCHDAKLLSGGLNLERFLALDAGAALHDREQWNAIAEKLRTGQMPPKGLRRPDEGDVAQVTQWIDGEYARIDRATKPDPGRVTVRRL